MEKEKSILVTGCSSGMGKGVAQKFVKEGFTVFGSVRNKKDGESLKKELGNLFHPLLIDVTKPATIQAAVKEVEKKLNGKGLGGLINNAGVVTAGPLIHMPMEEVRHMFEVNTFGPLVMIKAFLPLLGVRQNHGSLPGRIINISSNAGKISTPFLGAYCGSKFALEGMSGSLRQEVKKYGIDVIIVGPGFVTTNIGKHLSDISPYKKTDYFESMQKFSATTLAQLKTDGYTIDQAGEKIYNIFQEPKPKVRYAMVNKRFKNWTLLRIMPTPISDFLVAKIFGLQ